MKKSFFSVLIFTFILSGCALIKKDPEVKEKLNLANPASFFCLEQGGKSEIREGSDGQYGVCVFTDGSECEEWALYRLECKPGNSKIETKTINGELDIQVEKEVVEEQKNIINNITENIKKEVEKEIEVKEDVKEDVEEEKTEKIDNNLENNSRIKIFNLKSGDNLTSPVVIEGEGSAFENNLIVELRNNQRQTLVKEHTTIKSGGIGETGPFKITLNFHFVNTKEGFVAVYEESAEDGSQLNLVEIPVKFNFNSEDFEEQAE